MRWTEKSDRQREKWIEDRGTNEDGQRERWRLTDREGRGAGYLLAQ